MHHEDEEMESDNEYGEAKEELEEEKGTSNVGSRERIATGNGDGLVGK